MGRTISLFFVGYTVVYAIGCTTVFSMTWVTPWYTPWNMMVYAMMSWRSPWCVECSWVVPWAVSLNPMNGARHVPH